MMQTPSLSWHRLAIHACLSVCLSVLSGCLFVCLSVCVYLSVRLYVCLSLSMCLSRSDEEMSPNATCKGEFLRGGRHLCHLRSFPAVNHCSTDGTMHWCRTVLDRNAKFNHFEGEQNEPL